MNDLNEGIIFHAVNLPMTGDGGEGILNMWKAELESQIILTNWRDYLKNIGLSSIGTNAKC